MSKDMTQAKTTQLNSTWSKWTGLKSKTLLQSSQSPNMSNWSSTGHFSLS